MKQILLLLLVLIIYALPANSIAKQSKTISSNKIKQNQSNNNSLRYDKPPCVHTLKEGNIYRDAQASSVLIFSEFFKAARHHKYNQTSQWRPDIYMYYRLTLLFSDIFISFTFPHSSGKMHTYCDAHASHTREMRL